MVNDWQTVAVQEDFFTALVGPRTPLVAALVAIIVVWLKERFGSSSGAQLNGNGTDPRYWPLVLTRGGFLFSRIASPWHVVASFAGAWRLSGASSFGQTAHG